MNKTTLLTLLLTATGTLQAENWIRVNQVGYLNNDIKVAVMLMQEAEPVTSFTVTNAKTGETVTLGQIQNTGAQEPFDGTARLNFSEIKTPGTYYITAGETRSPEFRIGNDVYAGAQEIPLYYMRQQRCGFNPFINDSCHVHDGRLVLSGENDGLKMDVTGGWHDASDYLQYLTTSANAVYQMLFAYTQNPGVWQDQFDANGLPGSNGIPDILDEARWGLDWMVKMNPSDTLFLNQIADDRDHRFSGIFNEDSVDYGWGPGMERPVYPCSGTPYGLMGNLNDSKGLASSVGKFCSSFSLGAEVFGQIDPAFAALLQKKAANAYEVAKANPGACQTAPCVSPYYYEEDNWVDDMELAAMQMYRTTNDPVYLTDAVDYGRMEPVTPWMGADSAHHYQWYPFVNLGHALLVMQDNPRISDEFLRNMRAGLSRVQERAEGNAFLSGQPYIWCSNNLATALITQAMLYRELTGDTQFQELETATRDWLFGVNPWGKCMIIGLPEHGDWPRDPHSALTNLKNWPITGGIVDGPVYTNIFNSLRGVHLRNEDKYAPFQSGTVVYHDDYSDYATNEPTMDGTASTTYFLGKLSAAAAEE